MQETERNTEETEQKTEINKRITEEFVQIWSSTKL